MSEDLRAFSTACRTAARGLRRVPTTLRRELVDRVTPEIAEPLAGDVARSLRGPWATAIATGVKARRLADPTIVIGGARRVVSGGATVRDLVYGAQWGGGKRVTVVRRRGARPHRRRTTRQFAGRAVETIYPTLADRSAWILDQFAGIVLDVLDQELDHG